MEKSHDAISKSISRNIGVLTKLKYFVPENILYSLYCTLILLYINYGVLIWDNTGRIYLDKIFKLQKWAIRTISNSHYRSHTWLWFSNIMFLVFMIPLSSILVYLCTNIPQINFRHFFQRILLNMFKHTIT